MPRFIVKCQSRLRRLSSKQKVLGFVGIAIAGWFLAYLGAQLLIVQVPLEHADAIMVLSGSSRIAERNRFAAQLFNAGHAPRVILTNDNQQLGWDSRQQRNPYSFELARRILQTEGVPPDRIEVLMEPVSGTYEELQLVEQFASQRQLHSLLVVTSAYHSRRTWWTLNRVFKDKHIRLGLVTPSATISPWTWWVHPGGWRMVAGEYLKIGYYYWLQS